MTRARATQRGRWVAVLAVAALAAGCGSGDGPAGMDPDDSMLVATFESIQSNIFSAQCITCHAGANAPQGLRLDADNSYDLLVGVSSNQQPALLRVDPGNPDDSYLIRKLEGTAASGERMPLDLPPLPQSDIDVIRQWIAEGAPPPDSGAPTEPIRVSSMSPLPGATESMLPDMLMVMFDRELNAPSVNETTFTLERSGGDGSFDDGNEVMISPDSVSVPQDNPETAVMDLRSVSAVEDTYRVRVAGTGGAVVQDLDANALDGEFAGSFPSGDGEAGGDFVAEFEVVGIQPSLQSIQETVFTPSCSGCHTGNGDSLPASMDLADAAASYDNLVGVESVQQPDLERVTPGDADASYLIHKLEGADSISGEQMPAFAEPLEQSTIDTIRQWIDEGADAP